MSPVRPPLEHDLHALADRRLDPEQTAAVAEWLASHPGEAARLDDWRRQNEQLHAHFDAVLDEPVPARLLRAARGERAAWWQSRWAAAIGWLAIGVLVGLAAPRLIPREAPLPSLAGAGDGATPFVPVGFSRQAAIAHAIYSVEQRHPVEVTREQEGHLVQWLSRRTGVNLRVPDLNALGFALMGGRLLPGEEGPAAQFMYEDERQRRVTLYLGRENRREGGSGTPPAFGYASEQGTNVFYWVDGDVNYALSGNLERGTLLKISQVAYTQLSAAR